MTKKSVEHKPESLERVWELDALRGCAVLLMMLYHWVFLLRMMEIAPIDPLSLGWLIVARGASTTFLLLVGISLVVSFQKAQQHASFDLSLWRRRMTLRGLQIIGLGMAISAVTLVIIPQYPVVFGVLHLIGLSILVSLYLVTKPKLALGSAVVAFALGSSVKQSLFAGFPEFWQLLVGVPPAGFQSVDYWPVFPWMGLVLLGVAVGSKLFERYKRTYSWRFQQSAIAQRLAWLGKRALLVYLLHVPLLICVLWVVKVL
jgi:uncharacterized membrane protein